IGGREHYPNAGRWQWHCRYCSSSRPGTLDVEEGREPAMRFIVVRSAFACLGACVLFACGEKAANGPAPQQQAPGPTAAAKPVQSDASRQAYFGDLHLHTALSIDAFITGTRTLPDDAYRYAKGEPIDHVSGNKIQLKTPLDFLGVSDHSEL